MQKRLLALVVTASLSLFPLLLAGCGAGVSDTVTAAGTFHVTGKLHGGQQAVSGATIQLYAADTTTNAGAAHALLNKTVTTDAQGGFSITGDYTCDLSNPLVYIVATGGNPGLPGATVNNSALAMMSLLGTCKDLLTAGASQFTWINEFTTVASVQFAASFMTGYANVGSAPNNPYALAGAFQSYTGEVDTSTGQYQGGGLELQATELQINTLANILAACVNTDGTGAACSKLLSDTGSTDTVGAALHMVQSPGDKTSDLYSLIAGVPPFQPYFNSVPSDFTTMIGYTIPGFSFSGNGAFSGALDSNGRIWLYTGGYSYDTVAKTSTDIPGTITVYDNNFSPLFSIAAGTTPGSGGLYYPTSMAADASGNVYAVNANNTISKFDSNGNAVSPPTGWSTGVVSTFSPTGPGNGYIDSSSTVGPLVIDASGTIFGGVPFSFPSTNCYFQMSSAGVINTPSGNICQSVQAISLDVFTSDGSGDLWVLGGSAIGKADTSGNKSLLVTPAQGCFYSSQDAVGDPTSQSATIGLAYDHVHNQLWGKSETGVGAVSNTSATNTVSATFCKYGATMPALPVYRSTSTTPGAPYSAGSALAVSGVLDGDGNYFFISAATAATGVVGSSPGTFTGTATYSTYLGEISNAGAVVTPFDAASKQYGLQPPGLGLNGTVSSTNGGLSPFGNNSAALLGVDKFGNLWGVDLFNNRIFKITGLATANTVNY